MWKTLRYEDIADREFKDMTPEEKAFCREHEEQLDAAEEDRLKHVDWMEAM